MTQRVVSSSAWFESRHIMRRSCRRFAEKRAMKRIGVELQFSAGRTITKSTEPTKRDHCSHARVYTHILTATRALSRGEGGKLAPAVVSSHARAGPDPLRGLS